MEGTVGLPGLPRGLRRAEWVVSEESSDEEVKEGSGGGENEEDVVLGKLPRKGFKLFSEGIEDESSSLEKRNEFEVKISVVKGQGELPTKLDVGHDEGNSATKKALTLHERLKPSPAALQGRKQKAKEREWYELPTQVITPELKVNLQALQLRRFMNPSRFYKTSDQKSVPQEFVLGEMHSAPGEPLSCRIVKRDRKATFLDEVLSDDKVRAYTRRVFLDLQTQRKHDPFSNKKRARGKRKKGRGVKRRKHK